MQTLPDQWLCDEEGTWAHSTLAHRIPNDILIRILAENSDFLSNKPDTEAAIRALQREILAGEQLPLLADSGPDLQVWNEALHHINWRSGPYLLLEAYFYRRVAALFCFFETGYDCFSRQKLAGLEAAIPTLEASLHARSSLSVQEALLLSLRGNSSDLSLWPATCDARAPGSFRVVCDDSSRAAARCDRGQVHVVLDNAGGELLADLVLAETLLECGVEEVVLHCKLHPTFVSDTTSADVSKTIRFLAHPDCGAEAGPRPLSVQLGHRLRGLVECGRLQVREDSFWNLAAPLTALPGPLRATLGQARLVIFKGDMNYRRLVDDRKWPMTTPVDEAFSWSFSPMCALRVLKSEVCVGVLAEEVAAEDENWMVSGRVGVIQFKQ